MYFKVRWNGQPKTCILFCNIGAKRVELRCCALYHLRIKPVLQQIRLAGSLCTDAPPPLRKNREEWRLWIFFVNRVPVYICISYYFFLFSLWQLKRRWKTNTTLDSCTTRTQLLFFSEVRGRLYTGYSDGHGLKLEKVEPTFSSFDAMPAKISKKDHA